MSAERLRKQISVEKAQLRNLLQTHHPLLTGGGGSCPNPVELSAMAAMLHSFYTGIENILKRIAVELDGGAPTGEIWHRRLLDSMTSATTSRPVVISPELRDLLRGYLDFRHVFRHAYTFELRWQKMSALVLNCHEVLRRLESELDFFVERLDMTA